MPTWTDKEALDSFDQTQRDFFENTLNVRLTEEAWTQATLPVKKGGLGIRKAADLAIPACFSSLADSMTVGNQIQPRDQVLDTAMSERAKAI